MLQVKKNKYKMEGYYKNKLNCALWSLAVAPANQMVMDEVRMDPLSRLNT